jgi:hypothetical protein
MIPRIALMVHVSPNGDALRITDVASEHALPLREMILLLTLEREPGNAFATGHVRLMEEAVDYPFQSNAAFFEAVTGFLSVATIPD